MEKIRFLINDEGLPFDADELEKMRDSLLLLKAENEHLDYRDQNSAQIAQHPSSRMLIVSGPGTGKSYLFLERIKHWLSKNDGEILVTSFVNKLVQDLKDDVKKLSEEEQKRVNVTTLHSLARSILERNLGTSEWIFRPNIKIISRDWQSIVWSDVREFHSEINEKAFLWESFEAQLFNDELFEDENWRTLNNTYFSICQFYNAVGFADLIVRARVALIENKDLNHYRFFIIDEYQDFNQAEQKLLIRLAKNAEGVLIVGDDDQVLYGTLRQGKAELIRALYENPTFVNAILPFCTRCSFHIAQSAEAFIKANPDPQRISKVFLPVSSSENCERISIIACAHPAGVVSYVERFITEHKSNLEARERELQSGLAKDAYLLILSPAKKAKFLGDYSQELEAIVCNYAAEVRAPSQSFSKIIDYYNLGDRPNDNFAFRKILHHQGCSPAECHPYIREAIETGKPLASIEAAQVKEALRISIQVSEIIKEDISREEKLEKLNRHIPLEEETRTELSRYWEMNDNGNGSEAADEAETGELGVSRMNAVELMTIVGSKGLSADHVIILGFDNRNMSYLSPEAFYVAITRARQSLHLVTGLGCGGSEEAHEYLNSLPEECVKYCRYSKGNGRVSLERKGEFVDYVRTSQSVRRRTY